MSEEGEGKIRKSGATAHTGIPLPASPSAAEATAPAPAASAPTPPPSIPPCYPVAAASVAQTKALKIEPLPCCGIGFGWFLFIIGFFLPAITWYVGAFVHLFVRIDPREKPGYVACSIAAGFAAIATMIGAIQQLANWKLKSRIRLMAKEPLNPDDAVLAEEIGHVSLITLNRPRQLNVISLRVVELVAKYLEKWEKDANSKLVIFKGAGRAFCAGGDLKMFYAGRSVDCCLEVVYRMYWLCYHIHTYKKTMVALVHGIVMGGGGVMTVPLKFSVVTEKTIFSMPEASVGLHSDCSFSYILPRLPGFLGEYLSLTNARLNGKDMIALGLATHFVPSEKLDDLEKCLLSLNSGDENAVRNAIEKFSIDVLAEETILNKLQTINKCFCKGSLEEIVKSFEAEAQNDGNEWIWPVLKGFKRASPTGLKITLRSIREGRTQTLSECLKKEFKITMNLLKSVVSDDVYEGIRAFSIDKDNAPKWNPATFREVSNEKVELAFKPFNAELELKIADDGEARRWGRKYEEYVYSHL